MKTFPPLILNTQLYDVLAIQKLGKIGDKIMMMNEIFAKKGNITHLPNH